MPSALVGRLAETKSDMQQQALRRVAADASLSFAELAHTIAAYNGPLPPDIAASLGARLHALRPDVFNSAGNAEDLWRSGGLRDGDAGFFDERTHRGFARGLDQGGRPGCQSGPSCETRHSTDP